MPVRDTKPSRYYQVIWVIFRFNKASSIYEYVHEKMSYFIKLFNHADAYGEAEEMVNKETLVQRRLQ